jgi:hypothetical protein
VDFSRIINGMMRAMRLDKSFYEEVEHDPSYNQDALIVVILVSLVGAVGNFLGSLIAGRSFFAAIGGLIVGLLLAVLGYFLWVFVAHFVGTRFFKGSGERGEVQRAFGFAYAPQILNILAFIPCVGGLIGLVAWIWSIATGFVAIRQSLDQDNTNAALTVIVSAIVVFIVISVLGAIFAAMGLGVAAISGAFRG